MPMPSRTSVVAVSATTATCLLLAVLGQAAVALAGGPEPAPTGGLYFPLRSVELKLRVDSKSGNLLAPPGGLLLAPLLQADDAQGVDAAATVAPGAVTYRLTDPASPGQAPNLPWLSVDTKTGVLRVKEQRVLSDAGARRQHVVWLDARGSAAARAPAHRSARPFMVPAERARINITITFELVQEDRPCVNKKEGDQVARDDPCHYCHDSCFWERAELQVWENKQATMLAPLGHRYADLQCGDQHQYKLLSGTDHFEVRGSELWSRAMLDRDVVPVAGAQGGPGPAVVLAVECRTSWGVVEQRNVSVVVLDEDDNAPTLEKPDERLEFNFSTEASLARGAHILVKDMDSRAANRFSDLAVDDPSGVVTSKKLEFDVSHGGVPHTVVSVRLQVKDPMATKYNVTLTLTDLTLLDESKRELKLTATLWGPPLTPPVAMSSSDKDKADKPRTRRRAREIKTLDKGEENVVPDKPVALAATSADGQPAPVTLWTHAAQHARVAQVGRAGDGRAYRLGSEPPAWANVTELAGILYVQNRSLLQQQKSPARVVVQILDDEGRSLLVPVTLEAGGGDSPRNCTLSHETTCGQFFNKAECHAGCGAGSGSGLRGECVWREAVLTDPKPFATCSPHLPTCPDGECDPLEALSEHVCPQDCTGAC